MNTDWSKSMSLNACTLELLGEQLKNSIMVLSLDSELVKHYSQFAVGVRVPQVILMY